MKKFYIILFFLCSVIGYTQSLNTDLSSNFDQAYITYPSIPKGLLEAVAYTKTRMQHINPLLEIESCIGLPRVGGIMGMTIDGKGFFKNVLDLVSIKSGFSKAYILQSEQNNIQAYAKAFTIIQNELGVVSSDIQENISTLRYLSELPTNTIQEQYAQDTELYGILTLLNDPVFMQKFGYKQYNVKLNNVFGPSNYAVLSSKKVVISGKTITGSNNKVYQGQNQQSCIDYPGAIWIAADPSNFSSRNGTPISAVTIHTVQGSYSGCISYFQSSSANVSAHYVVRSSDGQITQMVCEVDKGWHVGTENPYTIGIEHEGFVSDPAWYTNAMYESSAYLVKDIINSGYGIDPLRVAFWPWTATTLYNQAGIPGPCTKIKGHMHFPNQSHTDPGEYWDWEHYYKLINDSTSDSLIIDSSGTLYDSGGPSADYTDDERNITVINPTNADSVTLEFISFDIEANWDYLYIYDGPTIWDSLIGYYTGSNSPGIVSSTGDAITLEFRSDCATTSPGWEVVWSACYEMESKFSFTDSGLSFTFIDSSSTTGNTTYLWDFGNGYMSNIQNPIFNYFSGGTYIVCQTVTNECGSDSSCQTISVVPVNINHWITDLNGFSIYPNPFTNSFYIERTSLAIENSSIKLFDLHGRVALDFSNTERYSKPQILKQEVDAQILPRGIYILEIRSPSTINRIKLLKL